MPPLAAPERTRAANKAQASLKGALQVLEATPVSPAQANNIRDLISKRAALELTVDETLAEPPAGSDAVVDAASAFGLSRISSTSSTTGTSTEFFETWTQVGNPAKFRRAGTNSVLAAQRILSRAAGVPQPTADATHATTVTA